MDNARLDAVWAATYVEVLSARQFAVDMPITAVAASLASPARSRQQIAIKAANEAVEALKKALVGEA